MTQRTSCVGILVLSMTVFGGQRTEAQTVSPGPYYATPSWDQALPCGSLASCPRFIVLSNFDNDAVLDRETGLVWERSPNPANVTQGSAVARCEALVIGNRMGWRLPWIEELSTLVDRTVSNPAMPPGHPFNNVTSVFAYRSATTDRDGNGARSVLFFTGVTISAPLGAPAQTPPDYGTWCVRGGRGLDRR